MLLWNKIFYPVLSFFLSFSAHFESWYESKTQNVKNDKVCANQYKWGNGSLLIKKKNTVILQMMNKVRTFFLSIWGGNVWWNQKCNYCSSTALIGSIFSGNIPLKKNHFQTKITYILGKGLFHGATERI